MKPCGGFYNITYWKTKCDGSVHSSRQSIFSKLDICDLAKFGVVFLCLVLIYVYRANRQSGNEVAQKLRIFSMPYSFRLCVMCMLKIDAEKRLMSLVLFDCYDELEFEVCVILAISNS